MKKKRHEIVNKGPYIKPNSDFYETEVIERPEVEKPYPNIIFNVYKGKQEIERWNK
jgi:hypothetical protein